VNTHGPLVKEVSFSYVASDASLKTDLLAGSIQGPEWTFTVTSYAALTACPTTGSATTKACSGSTATYEFDGISFNTIKPYINNVHFRQAIAYLTNYGYISGTVLTSGQAGTAAINVLPCAQNPGACYGGPNPYILNGQKNAYNDLVAAGLHPECGSSGTNCLTHLKSITDWYAGPGDKAVFSGGKAVTCTATSTLSACAFNPLFYYRSDDPLRSEVATNLCSAAKAIGLKMKCTGITGSDAGGDVYGASASAVVTPGTYVAATGMNKAPVYNKIVVNGSTTKAPTDAWDMYTFGWIVSAYYTWPYFFFNTAFATSDDFVEMNNATMNFYTNGLMYATQIGTPCTTYWGSTCAVTGNVKPESASLAALDSSCSTHGPDTCGAAVDASIVGYIVQQQLPYITSFYENQLWGVYANGWAGYANLPSTGPDTGVGLYYNLLNVAPTSCSTYPCSGNYKIGLHEVADVGGMTPIYNTEWVWQADIWGEIYDSPLATSPTAVTSPNVFVNYMVTSLPTTTSYTGTPAGIGVTFTSGASHKITSGELISFTFRNNITWSDNVPLTGADFQASLNYWDLTGCYPSCTSPAITPLAYSLSGAPGIIATQYVSSTNTVNVWLGSYSVWNLDSVDVPVLPMHIFSHFNVAKAATGTSAIDLTKPVTYSVGSSSPVACGCVMALNSATKAWMDYLPNLEVGSGPYYLYTYVEPPYGSGVMYANPTYQRTPWEFIAALPTNSYLTTAINIPISTVVSEFVRTTNTGNSLATKYVDVCAAKTTGAYAQSAATFTYTIYSQGVSGIGSAGSTQVATGTMTCTTGGTWSAATTPSGWTTPGTAGAYEVQITGTYTFQGLPRTWISFTGFTLS